MDIKELIYNARGSQRNMKQFARELGFSPAKLYRIADGDMRKPVSDDDLRTIVAHAAEDSTVTFEQLKSALQECIASKVVLEQFQAPANAVMWDRLARQAIMDNLYMANVKNKGVKEFHHSGYFDFGIEIERGDETKLLLFDVVHSVFLNRTVAMLHEHIGRIACSANDDQTWYYIALVDRVGSDDDNVRIAHMDMIAQQFSDVRMPFNISILLIHEIQTAEYHIEEICLRPEEQFISFNSSPFKE